jgi:leader peptidase (prepilin peptidase)/N-methyltransferase
MSCGTEIAARDNVPLVSYALLRGRCRHCGVHIPARYPLVEAGTALLAAACVLGFGLNAYGLTAAFFCAVLVVISAIDVEHRIVPNRIVLPAAAVVLAAQLLREPSLEWPRAALGASTVVLFARHGSAARKMAIPFAPFLALGALVALFAGDAILRWYGGLGG